mmetsp:Transcript_83313/g.259152  ORF Transcript_83313/g.259152 Transcript_83313/m.259152 type:complete len:308 (-) Transcript_83313:243-1166(-)
MLHDPHHDRGAAEPRAPARPLRLEAHRPAAVLRGGQAADHRHVQRCGRPHAFVAPCPAGAGHVAERRDGPAPAQPPALPGLLELPPRAPAAPGWGPLWQAWGRRRGPQLAALQAPAGLRHAPAGARGRRGADLVLRGPPRHRRVHLGDLGARPSRGGPCALAARGLAALGIGRGRQVALHPRGGQALPRGAAAGPRRADRAALHRPGRRRAGRGAQLARQLLPRPAEPPRGPRQLRAGGPRAEAGGAPGGAVGCCALAPCLRPGALLLRGPHLPQRRGRGRGPLAGQERGPGESLRRDAAVRPGQRH